MRWIKDWDEISRKEEGNINAIRIYIYISHYELGRFINEVVQFRK